MNEKVLKKRQKFCPRVRLDPLGGSIYEGRIYWRGNRVLFFFLWREGRELWAWGKKTGRNNWGARQTVQPRVPVQEKKASKPLAVITCGGFSSGRNSQPHRRVHWRDPQGPRMYPKPPTWESTPEGPNLLVNIRGSDWKPAKSQATGTVPSQTPPPHTTPQPSK